MPDTRTPERIRAHYEIERRLAARLRGSNKAERGRLYSELYDELFKAVPDHPQHRRKVTAKTSDEDIARQLAWLAPYLNPASVYLEVGCGDCHVAHAIARRVRQAYGADVSAEITRSADAPANFELLLSDGTSIPAADVDVIYSNQLMEHLHPEDAAEQLDNIFRALKPGGTYVCITPNRVNGPHDVSKHFDRTATGFHLHEYTYRELSRLFRTAGFAHLQAVLDWRGRRVRVPIWVASAIERLAELIPALARTRAMGRLLPVRIAATRIGAQGNQAPISSPASP
jgi:SAM-dependent methyltransferase